MDYLQPGNFFTMVPEVKARWLEDLRSGNVPQGRFKLHLYDGSMCCLGLLMKQAEESGEVREVVLNDQGYYYYDGHAVGLSVKACKWAGLYQPGRDLVSAQGIMPFVNREGHQVYLDTLNDDGFTFNQIADLIECFY